MFDRVLITGGAGYVGAVLVPKLLRAGYRVRVLDWYVFGRDVLDLVRDHPNLEQIKGDIRDEGLVQRLCRGCGALVHLACISNDPSSQLNPALTRAVNLDAFGPLVRQARASGVRRFLFASSSSVYGVSKAPDVKETHPLAPLTDYSRYKAMCEPVLLSEWTDDFVPIVVRPATVCGYSPRMRLDLTVNILTSDAVHRGRITVFGGSQLRPNIHVQDLTDLYAQLLAEPDWRVAGRIYNAGYQNLPIARIAKIVQRVVSRHRRQKESRASPADPVRIETTPSDDLRSYHISSEKVRRELGFVPRWTIEDAVRDLVRAFGEGLVPEPQHVRYSNVRTMQAVGPRLLRGVAA